MNGFIVLSILGFFAYIIAIILLPHVIWQDTYIHDSGICVVTSPLSITTPGVNSNGNVVCKTGKLVKTLPNGS